VDVPVPDNPLTHTDPSGYLSTREWGSIFTTLIITFGTGGQGLVAQLAGGAMLGATQSQSIKGAAWGAFSSLAYFGVGSYFESAAWAKTGVHVFGTKLNLAGYSAKVLSHGVLGGGVQHLQGGRFGSGFAAAGLTEATSGMIDGIDPSNPDVSRALRIATAGMVGGTASALTGGKFAAGFITAAFARAYNAEGHEETCDEVCVIERDYRELRELAQNRVDAAAETASTMGDVVEAVAPIGVVGKAKLAGRVAARGAAAAVRVGQAGEAAVRAAVNIGPATRITVNGATRIPDGLTARVLSEVKNVSSQSYTQQLRDFASFAQQTGRQFDLYVRPNTQLSGPLLDAINAGQINLRYIPGL
jgi:hypothetical protein